MSSMPVNIFWTGGWDSTFRVLQLLLIEKKKVQPYFVVRPQSSVGKEINTMIEIRRKLFRNFPKTRKLLKPTEYVDIRSIEENENISEIVDTLNKKQQFAKQYDFCSRYCHQMGIYDMELSNEKGGRIQGIIETYISDGDWRAEKLMSEEEKMYYEVFKYFKFPLLNISKL